MRRGRNRRLLKGRSGDLPLTGTYPITLERLKALREETGLQASIIVFFLQWPFPEAQRDAEFPLDTLETISRQGAIPCITWEPMYYRGGREITIHHHEITSGRYDAYIIEFARQTKSWGRPLIIRFGHEMNIARYHWRINSDTTSAYIDSVKKLTARSCFRTGGLTP